MKFLPVVVTAVTAFQLPHQGVNTAGKTPSPPCTSRFLYIDTDDDPSNRPRVLITPPNDVDQECIRLDKEFIQRSLLAERLRLEQKAKATIATETPMAEPVDSLKLSNDDQLPPRVIIPPSVAETSAPATELCDGEAPRVLITPHVAEADENNNNLDQEPRVLITPPMDAASAPSAEIMLEEPRVLVTPPADEIPTPSVSFRRDEELVHRALLVERLRMDKQKNSDVTETELVEDIAAMNIADAFLVVKKKSAERQERFQRALLEERLQMEKEFRSFGTTAGVNHAVAMEEVPSPLEDAAAVNDAEADVIPSWQQELIKKSAVAVGSHRQQKRERVQRAILQERLRLESKIRQSQAQPSVTVVGDLVENDEKAEQVLDSAWEAFAPESDGSVQKEQSATWSSDEILAGNLEAEALVEQPEVVITQSSDVADNKELFQRLLLEARLKMESKAKNLSKSEQNSPVTAAKLVVTEIEEAAGEVEVISAAPTVSVGATVSPKLTAPLPHLSQSKKPAKARESAPETKKISEIAKYVKTMSAGDIASGVVDAFKPEKGVMQLLKEDDDDLKLLGYAASQLSSSVVDGSFAAFLTLRAFVGNAPASSSDEKESDSNVISSSVQKEMEKIADVASESTKHAVSGCVALAALTFRQLTRARDYLEEQKIEIELANQRRLAEQKKAEILRARIEEEKRIERELDNERRLAEQKAVEIIKARTEEAKRKLEIEAVAAEEKVVNQIRMDVETKKKSLLNSPKKDNKEDEKTMQSNGTPFFARNV